MKNKQEQKRGKGYLLIPVLMFLCGLAVLIYPFYTDWLYREDVREQKGQFDR